MFHVRLTRGRKIIAGDVSGSCDPFIEMAHANTKGKSEVGQGEWKTPTWNQEFNFSFQPQMPVLDIILYDHDGLTGNDALGSAKVALHELQVGKPMQRWHELWAPDGSIAGEIEITMELKKYHLKVDVVRADGLKADDGGFMYSSSDPFAVVRHARQSVQTEVIKENLKPEWNTSFQLTCFESQPVEVEVLDYDMAGDNDRLGIVSIPINRMLDGRQNMAWYDLADKVGSANKAGRVQIGITVSTLNYPNWPPAPPPKPAAAPPPPTPAAAPPSNNGELQKALARIAALEADLADCSSSKASMEMEINVVKNENEVLEAKLRKAKEKLANAGGNKDREAQLSAELSRVKAELDRALADKASVEGQLKVSFGSSDRCTGELEAELEKSKSLLALLREARVKASRDRSSSMA